MKKIIALLLCVITIVLGGWIIVKNINDLDIVANKTDWYVSNEKRKINERTDIDSCEKQILTERLDQGRANDKLISNKATRTLEATFIVLIIQIILLVTIALMPRKGKSLEK